MSSHSRAAFPSPPAIRAAKRQARRLGRRRRNPSPYNTALASIPYQDFIKRDESLYRSLFLMLLRGAGITAHGEVPTNRGRSDVLVLFPHCVVVLEFKLALSESKIDRLRLEGQKQMEENSLDRKSVV